MKISPSKILNYYYPMPDIPKDILERAGARGSIVHARIEEALNNNNFTINKNEYLLKGRYDERTYYQIMNEDDLFKVNEIWEATKKFVAENQFEPEHQELYIQLDKIHGYVDFIGTYNKKNVIVDWKTNSALMKKDIEKYSLQMNLYRYMHHKANGVMIHNLYLSHLSAQRTKQGVKYYSPKMIECPLIPFEKIEQIIDEVYNFYNTQTIQSKQIAPQPQGGTMLNIRSMETAIEQKNKLVFVMGEPKSGKTTFANTAITPEQKGLYIECGYDNGWSVLGSNFDVIAGTIRNDKVTAPDGKIIQGAKHAGVKLIETLMEINSNPEFKKYDFIIIDPISNIQEEIQNFIEEQKGAQMNQQEWGIIANCYEMIKKEIMSILDFADVMLIAHVKTLASTNDLTGETSTNIIPSMTENNGKKFTKVADMIGFTTAIKKDAGNTYGIIIGGHGMLPTGIRTGKAINIPANAIKPDYQEIKRVCWEQ